VLSVAEMLLMPILIPWPIFSIQIQDQLLHVEAPEGMLSARTFFILFNVMNILCIPSPFFYEYYKRKSSKILYGIDSPSIFRYL